MNTVQFLQDRATTTPEGALAATDLPDEVTAELRGAGVNIGTFLTLLPLILQAIRLFTSEGATVADIWAIIQEIIKKLQPAG